MGKAELVKHLSERTRIVTSETIFLTKGLITEMVMELRHLLRDKRAEIFAIAAKYGASNIRVFGSVARGEEHPDSDVDFLVEIEPGKSLLDQIALMQDLEELLGRKVDVAEPETLHERIRDRVLQDAVPL